jgi:hypothetical protein
MAAAVSRNAEMRALKSCILDDVYRKKTLES